jgi:hypothetical protein
MSISLDPSDNPIIRLYQLLDEPGVQPWDDAYSLGISSVRLTDLGSERAQEIVKSLRDRASDALHTCRLTVRGQPLVSFVPGSVLDWFEWDVIDDLVQEGALPGGCDDVLLDWKQRLGDYEISGYWPRRPGGDIVTDCLSVLGELEACGHDAEGFCLELALDKTALLEQHMLEGSPGLSGKVSVLIWRNVESMIASFHSFHSFLKHMAQAASRPILLLFYEATDAYRGDYFKIYSLGGPTEALEAREHALAEQVQAFTTPILVEYDELRMRSKYESRPNVGERLDLPPALLLRQARPETSYPVHPLLQGGPLRSLQLYMLMAWLAEYTKVQDAVFSFAVPSAGAVCLEFRLADVTQGGTSLFQAETDWQDGLLPLVHDMQRSAGRGIRRALWARALANRSLDDFEAGKFFGTLRRVHAYFVALERKFPQITDRQPDLELRIFWDPEDYQFDFELDSPTRRFDFHNEPVGSIAIHRGDLAERFRDLNRLAEQQLEKVLVRDARVASRGSTPDVGNLTVEGRDLWKDLVPPDLKTAYEAFGGQEEGDVTLLIVSNDPSFPWELVMPYRTKDGFYGLWWAVEFSLARWLAGYPPPASRIGFERVCCVATSSQLSSAEREVAFFESNNVQLDTPQTQGELLNLLCERDYDILHFACHGRFDTREPDRSVLQLPDGSLFRPKDLLLRVNEITGRLKGNRPLVFLNACHSGRVGPSLTHLEGWAEAFIEMGCGAFIGCGWEVSDPLAAEFAIRFYEGFRGGKALGQAVHAARHRIRADHPTNSTWLAYYLYGDPNCMLKEP